MAAEDRVLTQRERNRALERRSVVQGTLMRSTIHLVSKHPCFYGRDRGEWS